MATSLNVFVGYDKRQPIAFQVLCHSIWQHATTPVSITRLDLKQLPIQRRGLTEFTYSRFLVPYLSNYEGVSIFLDSDMLVRGDLVELLAWPLAYTDASVFVVDHCKRNFERPSLMVFNNANCKILTPEFIENQDNKLFDFKWANGIGTLFGQWNHLVGYDEPNAHAKVVHFTMGIPIWPETKNCEYSEEWQAAMKASCSSVSFSALMGQSVHVPHMRNNAAVPV